MIQAIKNLNFLKKWYVIDSQTAKERDNKSNSMKFETESVKSSLCDYPGAYTLVTGDITVNSGTDTKVLFKNWASFTRCKTEIYEDFIDKGNHISIAMPMYNLIYNTVIIIQIHQETYGSLKKMNLQLIKT